MNDHRAALEAVIAKFGFIHKDQAHNGCEIVAAIHSLMDEFGTGDEKVRNHIREIFTIYIGAELSSDQFIRAMTNTMKTINPDNKVEVHHIHIDSSEMQKH